MLFSGVALGWHWSVMPCDTEVSISCDIDQLQYHRYTKTKKIVWEWRKLFSYFPVLFHIFLLLMSHFRPTLWLLFYFYLVFWCQNEVRWGSEPCSIIIVENNFTTGPSHLLCVLLTNIYGIYYEIVFHSFMKGIHLLFYSLFIFLPCSIS